MIGLPRSTYYRRPKVTTPNEGDALLATAITAVRRTFPAYGYRRVTKELRRRGVSVNHKRVQRVMRTFLADVGRFPPRTDHFTRRLTDGNTLGGTVMTGDPAMNVTYRRT